jgi:hypothetical protein
MTTSSKNLPWLHARRPPTTSPPLPPGRMPKSPGIAVEGRLSTPPARLLHHCVIVGLALLCSYFLLVGFVSTSFLYSPFQHPVKTSGDLAERAAGRCSSYVQRMFSYPYSDSIILSPSMYFLSTFLRSFDVYNMIDLHDLIILIVCDVCTVNSCE